MQKRNFVMDQSSVYQGEVEMKGNTILTLNKYESQIFNDASFFFSNLNK